MTLTIESPQVYTQLGVAISVTGIAQVTYLILCFSFKIVHVSHFYPLEVVDCRSDKPPQVGLNFFSII